MAGSFLGTGMKFPPQIDPATGRIATSSEKDSVKESVYLILMTSRSERYLRPDFGSTLLGFTFMDTNSTTLGMLQQELTNTLVKQEPRIGAVEINMEYLERKGALLINVDYTLRSSNIRDNLVFPFYLNADFEEESPEEETEIYEAGNDEEV
ncbi:MAG: GPW/gp25 family protein [Lachnospiraceae bacterium]|nr:GPW/gp25 family protein [Lachnospiraceae bacterium]